MLADARSAVGIGPLEQGVHAVADAMGEQIEARAGVEQGEPIPQCLVVVGNVIAPALVSLGDLARGRAVLQLLGLCREEDMIDAGLEAAGRCGAPEGVADQLVQQHGHGHVGMFRNRVAQSEGAMRGQLDDEALGQRLDAVLLIVLRLRGLAADGDDGALNGGRGRLASFTVNLLRIAAFGLDGTFILGTYIAAINQQRAVGVEADEDAGDGDVGRIVDRWALLEGVEGLFDLAETCVDLVRQLVGFGIFGFEPVVFVAQRFAGGALLIGQVDRDASQFAKPMLVAVGKAQGGLDPFPAFARDLVGGGLQLVGHQAVEQGRILQPATIVRLEQVAQHDAAGRLISLDADEDGPFV